MEKQKILTKKEEILKAIKEAFGKMMQGGEYRKLWTNERKNRLPNMSKHALNALKHKLSERNLKEILLISTDFGNECDDISTLETPLLKRTHKGKEVGTFTITGGEYEISIIYDKDTSKLTAQAKNKFTKGALKNYLLARDLGFIK